MSVRTTADEKLYEAAAAISVAQKALNEIVVESCWGHDEFNQEFMEQLEVFFDQLTKMRIRLKGYE